MNFSINSVSMQYNLLRMKLAIWKPGAESKLLELLRIMWKNCKDIFKKYKEQLIGQLQAGDNYLIIIIIITL